VIRSLIDATDELLASFPGIEASELADLTAPARTRALALSRIPVERDDGVRQGGRAYIGELVCGLSLAHTWSRAEVEALVDVLAEAGSLARDVAALEIYLEVVRHLQTSELPPGLAIETQLRVLVAFAPVAEASLWTAEPGRAPRCLAFVGAGQPTRRVRAAARELLGGRDGRTSERGHVHAVPVSRWQQSWGALVVRARPADRARAVALARESALTLATAIERSMLLERSAARERSLVEASERRIARLGFDIHDGPIQDVVALAADIRLFRTQLGRSTAAPGTGDILLGRIDDFDARLVALDRELRELAHAFERSSAVDRPFAEVLRRQVAAFTTRNDVTVSLDLRGDFDQLTNSQRLAIAAVVREALTNVRDHSGASEATISVAAGRARTHASVADNGRGFDVDRTLVSAARRGRLGLVGMSERIRLLGGRLELESRPGGPTRVAVSIPRWTPLAQPAAAATARAS
jgi:signal transduction histidine kinase